VPWSTPPTGWPAWSAPPASPAGWALIRLRCGEHVTLEPQPIMLDGREIARSTERHAYDRSYYRGVKRR
jgi:hypothetical protein